MKFLTQIVLFVLLFTKVVVNFDFSHLRPVSRNKVSLEKFICKYQPGSKIDKNYKCLVKYIDRNHLKIDVWGNLTEPITSMKFRVTLYYKYSTYQRMGGDLNVNACEVLLMKKKRMPIVEWFLSISDKLTNLNHTCPYSGYLFAKADNVSIDEFAYPDLMPAGRYRIDTTVFEDNDRILFNTSLFYSVSDHRVDIGYSKL